MVKTVKNLTNIKLTESDTDGIWLHFEAEGKKAGISLDEMTAKLHGGIVGSTIQAWAREQLDKQKNKHRRFELGTRPSPPVEGGY